ncbi:MAG: hypothetical protein QNJ40_07160 [Xanthomonadales bacterium]|nr:hypothetical protein [Xanthomonadales bacterium]
MNPALNAYRNVHLWLLIPFVIIILGFLPTYWLQFSSAPWRHHLHGLTATAWFVLLIAQPYLVTRGHVRQHRLFGMLALVLAGGVIVSGLGAIPYNLVNERLPETARYGLSFLDLVLVPGFAAAVVMAVVSAKRPDDHARWMISTVFWAVSPGLFRLLLVPMFIIGVADVDATVPWVLGSTGVVNILVLGFLMLRERRAHPAYLLAAVGSLVLLIPMQIGQAEWWRAVANALFKI